jgi:NAD(P)-dependent dehydrogenase (short-subunit alcohol dehydrogenase family)
MTGMRGKVALVTGAGSGIGEAVVRRFAAAGATIGIVGRRPEPLDRLAEDTGAIPLPCDVADPAAVRSAIGHLLDQTGGLDIVVNNAAITGQGSVDQIDEATWQQVMGINVNGAFQIARETVPHLKRRGGGAIVNVSSIGGLFGAPGAAAYGTTKAAILGLTRAMARDHGPDGIRVNTICPGWVDTPMADPAVELIMQAQNLSREEAQRHLTRFNPISGMASPDSVARCIEFLATDASACVTGTILMADNGQSIVDVGFIPIQMAFEALHSQE